MAEGTAGAVGVDRRPGAPRPAGKGVEWNDAADIVGGSAGTGLFLLYAAKELEEPACQDLAATAGHRLIELARREGAGLRTADCGERIADRGLRRADRGS